MTPDTQPEPETPDSTPDTPAAAGPLTRRRTVIGALLVGAAAGVLGLSGGTESLVRLEHAVCGLPADELALRREWYRETVMPHVAAVQRDGEVVRFVVNLSPRRTKALADEMIAKEADCCSFLTIRHATDVGPAAIEIAGPDSFLDWAAGWLELPGSKAASA